MALNWEGCGQASGTEKRSKNERFGGKIELLSRDGEWERGRKNPKPTTQRHTMPAGSCSLSSWRGRLLVGAAAGRLPSRVGGVLGMKVQGCQMSRITYQGNFVLPACKQLTSLKQAGLSPYKAKNGCCLPWWWMMLTSFWWWRTEVLQDTQEDLGSSSGMDTGSNESRLQG